MSEKKEAPKPRAPISLSLDGLDENVREAPQDMRAIREVAERTGFMSREPMMSPAPKSSVKKHRRPRTGRDYAFNTKIRPQTYELLSNLATVLTEEEGRVVSMAEVLERALEDFSERRLRKHPSA